jgi:hypothetical protein
VHALVATALFSALAVTIALVVIVERRPQRLAPWRVRYIRLLLVPVGFYVLAANALFPGTRWLATIAPAVVLPTTTAQAVIFATGLRTERRTRASVRVGR